METKEALDILKRHNIWRRGADIEPINPERLGKALDKAIEVLGSDVSQQRELLINSICCTEFETVDLDPEIAKSLNDFCNKQGKKQPTKKRF